MDVTGFNATKLATWYVSPLAGELTKTLKSVSGQLIYLRGCNTTASTIYIFVFDNTAASGTLLMPPIPVTANSQYEIKTFSMRFATGCTVSASTTQTSYTAAGANAMHIHALYS